MTTVAVLAHLTDGDISDDPVPPPDERERDWTMKSAPIEPDLKSRSSHPTLTASLLMVGVALAIVLIAAAGVRS